ncbi:WecB/TagA/CpsF family glycosyltransferase [Vibrio alginolyticus]|uniref:WecB/TagA/CpsF family glycosyltransferase n=1 Tax=Vibrio alginolyticus TaxID=663 RepID=UPI001C930572|nr:WecB/TagA/CpsF family glycosyltransferase [Vibrio alginolyticus]MBY4648148.1 WecB/TagA/CpsF family glycosyltransferase [Vibrio alginolyticus]
MSENINILGYNVSSKSIESIVSEALTGSKLSIVNTINPHSYVEAKKDKIFRTALKRSDVIIPDGSGIVLAAKKLHGVNLRKVAGADLFFETMTSLNSMSGKVFFLGSTDEVLEKIKNRAAIEFPNVAVEVLSPPYKPEFSDEDKQSFIDSINRSSSDVIFVGLTAPKQEKLIHDISAKIQGQMVSGIGAVFDFYAGSVNRPKQIWLDMHLEWFVRLLGEPKRLWKRTFVSAPIFLFDLYRAKLMGKNSA